MNIIIKQSKFGDDTNNPDRIVVHSMGERINDGDKSYYAHDWLDHLGLSAHALIWPNGDVMITRNTDQGAYHARGFNKNSLGVEFLVEGEHDYGSFLNKIKTDWATGAQMKEGAKLIRRWQKIYSIKRDRVDRHSDLSPGRKVDPGTGFKWGQLLSAIEK